MISYPRMTLLRATTILLFLSLWTAAFCGVWNDEDETSGMRATQLLDAMSRNLDAIDSTTEQRRSWGYGAMLSSLTSTVLRRRDDAPAQLQNNEPSRNSIAPGDTHQFVFSYSQTETQLYATEQTVPASGLAAILATEEAQEHSALRREIKGHTIYLSLSLCALPLGADRDSTSPTGLELLVLTNNNSEPEDSPMAPQVHHLLTEEGLAVYSESFTDDLYFAVHAPNIQTHRGEYTYEIAASIDTWYTTFDGRQSLFVIDQDHQTGLLSTVSLADSNNPSGIESWMASGAPFTIFVHRQDDPEIVGMRRSYCGLEDGALIKTSSLGVEKVITTAGTNSARQQFYIPGLNSSTSYHAIMGLPSNYSTQGPGVPTGGGLVWRSAEFTTNTDESCQVLHDLEFCDSVSYAVPAPANGSVNATELGRQYDFYAQDLYSNFSLSLQQIPCNTTPEAQYSLATNCSNCAAAYKQWLCAVTIPRCADTAKNTSASISRNASTSRSTFIQQQIQPGNYNEIPPCGDLCYGLVQHCPASLGFSCPGIGSWYFNQSYGYPGGSSNEPTCNSPDKVFGVSSGFLNHPSMLLMVASGVLLTLLLG